MRKFLLINVPSYENAYHGLVDFVAIQPPIGLVSIAAVLEQNGYTAEIIDGDAENITFAQALERVIASAPDVIGATTMTATMDLVAAFFAEFKRQEPDIPVIVGGPHVSALPKETLQQFPQIDIVVQGEGDDTVVELMAAFQGRRELATVKGICFRQQDRIVQTEPRPPLQDLGKLPIPAYHLLKYGRYRAYGWNRWVDGHRRPLGNVFMGRGCIGRCNFCASRSVFGKGIRFFPLERIKAEIDLLVKTYQIRILYFEDDTFTVNRKLINQICDFLIERGYHKRLQIMVSARVDTVHLPTLRKMRRAGIRWICFGVESGNQAILDRMHKNITLDQIRAAFDMARAADLYVAGNFMIGHIGETRPTAMDTIRLACQLKQDYTSFAIAIPFPGTELYQHCLDQGIKLPPWNNFGSVNTPPIALSPKLDAQTLMELRDTAVNHFFKRPLYVLGLLWRFKATMVLGDFLKMYFAIRREKRAKRL